MAKNIGMRLTEDSIQRAIEKLQEYRKSIPVKTETVKKRVSEYIRDRIETDLGNAIADSYWQKGHAGEGKYTDKPDFRIEVSDNGDCTVIAVIGEDAVYVEFGTGVTHNGGTPGTSLHPKGVELGALIGKKGKHRGSHKTWGFIRNGERYLTHGIPAQMPIWNILQECNDEVIRIAKEVFGNG